MIGALGFVGLLCVTLGCDPTRRTCPCSQCRREAPLGRICRTDCASSSVTEPVPHSAAAAEPSRSTSEYKRGRKCGNSLICEMRNSCAVAVPSSFCLQSARRCITVHLLTRLSGSLISVGYPPSHHRITPSHRSQDVRERLSSKQLVYSPHSTCRMDCRCGRTVAPHPTPRRSHLWRPDRVPPRRITIRVCYTGQHHFVCECCVSVAAGSPVGTLFGNGQPPSLSSFPHLLSLRHITQKDVHGVLQRGTLREDKVRERRLRRRSERASFLVGGDDCNRRA